MDLTNDGGEPFVLWVEPWAHDFTLAAGQTFRLIASSSLDMPHFALSSGDDSRDVVGHLEGPTDISFVVLEGEHELSCGPQ